MKKLDLFELQQIIKENKIILLFEGEFSQGILKNLVETLKEKLSMDENEMVDDEKYFIAKKVYSIFIELAQNIQHYSAQRIQRDDHEVGTGVIIIIEDSDCFRVTSGNWVKKDQTAGVIEKCEHINSLEAKELRKFYKEKLRAPRPEGSKGAGLGLIQMARQSGNKLEFSSQNVDSEHDFLILEVKVNKEG